MDFFVFCGSIFMIQWLCTLMNNEYWYLASSKSGSNTTAEQRGNWSRYACRVLSRVRLQSTLDSTIPGIFLWRSEKTLYPAGLVGIDRLERHLGLDIDDIVARQHSNWYRSRCWYLKIKFVILLLYYCLRYISSLAPQGAFPGLWQRQGNAPWGRGSNTFPDFTNWKPVILSNGCF